MVSILRQGKYEVQVLDTHDQVFNAFLFKFCYQILWVYPGQLTVNYRIKSINCEVIILNFPLILLKSKIATGVQVEESILTVKRLV